MRYLQVHSIKEGFVPKPFTVNGYPITTVSFIARVQAFATAFLKEYKHKKETFSFLI